MSDYYIHAGWSYSNNNLVKDALIVIQDDLIAYSGKFDSKEISTGMEKYDYPKGLITPPFINSHTHISETLIRGICDDADLHEWLYNHVWKVEPMMKKEDGKIGAQLAVAEMVSSGTIGFVDQYFYSNEIAEVVNKTGMKAYICPSIFEGNPETKTIDEAYKKNIQIIEKWHGQDNRIFIGLGPHAPYSVDDDTFLKIYDTAVKYNTMVHTHLNETRREVQDSLKEFNMTPIEKMANLGILNRILAAHCIHLNDKDINLLKNNKVNVLHCIQSNLKIAAGIAPIPKLIENNINVCLGSDGNASNNNLAMLEEMRLTAILHKGINYDPKMINTDTVMKMATSNASKIFPNQSYSGIIESGHPADLLLINLDKVNTTPIINPLSNWVYSGNSSNIEMTISNGKILYHQGKYNYLNIEKIKSEAQNSIERMMVEANYSSD